MSRTRVEIVWGAGPPGTGRTAWGGYQFRIVVNGAVLSSKWFGSVSEAIRAAFKAFPDAEVHHGAAVYVAPIRPDDAAEPPV